MSVCSPSEHVNPFVHICFLSLFFFFRSSSSQKHYTTADMFIEEVYRMFSNCRRYNHQQTIYYKYANELEKFVTPKLQALKQSFQRQQQAHRDRAAARMMGGGRRRRRNRQFSRTSLRRLFLGVVFFFCRRSRRRWKAAARHRR